VADRYPAPHRRRSIIGWRLGQVVFRTLYDVQVVDRDRVPRRGAAILVSNHLGFLDGPLLFGTAPRAANIIVKKELFHGFVGWLLRALGQIPIDRTTGDRNALMTAVSALDDDRVVGVFPEGTRGRGDVAHIHQGATWLALRTGAPVVPVTLLGTRKRDARGSLPGPRSRVIVAFGEPFTLKGQPGLPGRDQRRIATEQMRVAMTEHVQTTVERVGMALPERPPSDVSDNG
jgi:1-acyl-sn-glycerol-3-phosphate acyltransferase